jgi:hypothetical protein
MYVDNQQFYEQICLSLAQQHLTPAAEKTIILIANRLITKFNYHNLADKHDCLQEGLLEAFTNWHKFKPDRTTNAFAFFTQLLKNGMMRGHNKLYRAKKVWGVINLTDNFNI